MWPQLPRLGLLEQMEIQYSEGMPRAVVDREKSRMYFDTSGDYSEEFGAFYEAYMEAMDPDSGSGDCSAMTIGPEIPGIYALEARLAAEGGKRPYVKVQTTGPCSFALTVTDENKRAIYYNEEFRDVVVKALAMKCRWQIAKFRPFAERLICFIDEPILSAFGSSTYISVKREDVVPAIAELVDAIHAEGAVAGVHCCGNTDWSILVDAGRTFSTSTPSATAKRWRSTARASNGISVAAGPWPGASSHVGRHPRAERESLAPATRISWTISRAPAHRPRAHPRADRRHALVRARAPWRSPTRRGSFRFSASFHAR